MRLDRTLVDEIPIDSWKALLDWYEQNQNRTQWLFRGQRKSGWDFKSSLERISEQFVIAPADMHNLEDGLLSRFKRQIHHYMADLPDDDDITEWLALMQHYGAPTRLLDWTHSLFVALYFAIEYADGESAVWALDNKWLLTAVESKLSPAVWSDLVSDRNVREKKTFDDVFGRSSQAPLVCSIKPYRFNDRVVVQQGAFLCPADISTPFNDNMNSVLSLAGSNDKLILLKISGDLDTRKKILKHLFHMNMNRATLFPGLNGFAESLKMFMAFPEFLSS